MNAGREDIPSGDIVVEGGRLVHVGAPVSPSPPGAQVIDGRGKIAVPGFINAHHHLFQSLLRGLSPNENLLQWIESCILATTPHFRPEDLYWGVRLSLAECVESGVTTTIDWAYNLHSLEHAAATFEAMRDSGVRVHYAFGPSLLGGNFDLDLKRLEDFRALHFGGGRRSGRLTLWAGPGGPNFQPEGRVREEVECVRGWGLPLHVHVGENVAQEPRDALEVLGRCGALGPHLLLAHAIHLRDSDLDLLASTGTKVSYNTLSNMRVASGICRVVEMRARGVDVGLGLDGSAASDNNDYFALMRAALGLQRARWLRADCLTVEDIVQMATIEGARCLGQDAEVGSLESGKRADFLLIEPRTLNFMPSNRFVSQLIFCAQPRNVDTVIVDGQVLKRGGELVGVEVEELLDRCQRAAGAVTGKAGLPRDPMFQR